MYTQINPIILIHPDTSLVRHMTPISKAEFIQLVPLEQLRSASILGAISEDAIEFLLERGCIHRVQKREKIFGYGDRGNTFYIVGQGQIDFYKHHNGESLLTREATFGNELGFVSMIALHDRTGEAYAHEDSLLIEISSDVFASFHEEFPFDFGIITLNLARDMARTLRSLANSLVDVSSRL